MSFASDVKAFAAKTGQAHDRIARGVELRLFRAVIMDTPVDEGRLRGDWQTTSGSPAQTQSGRVDETGAATVAAMEAMVSAIKGGNVTMLSNNMPYAYRVELEGWSHTKAPQGMVRKNVARFQRLFNAEARKHRV